ncbi:lymphocyte expansion molecule [Calypte anna]|uniref:lymphocyte expansion molecule n=1 Tax=Calypte anna TaxID=9244 RepID=UPI0004BF953C|nr:lymphocyte expansion molecule [Calypte anna]
MGSGLIHLPKLRPEEIMKERRRQLARLGPGTYNIRDFLQETRPSSLRGICNTREQRFRDTNRDCFPGPGTYGNPYTHLEERDKRSVCTRGLLDCRVAKRGLPELTGSGLGPGTYNLRSSIDEKLREARGSWPCPPTSRGKLKPTRGGRGPFEKDTKLTTGVIKGFLDELISSENKKKGCFSTLPRNPGCPSERIFWATLSQCPREAYAVGPGSYDPKPVERTQYPSQAPFWSSAKRFDRKSFRLFTGNEQHQQHIAEAVQNPVGVGRYDITKKEKYPQNLRYQSLYRCDTERYLSNLKKDVCLLERLKPVGKNNWSALISAPRCRDNSEESTAVSQT